MNGVLVGRRIVLGVSGGIAAYKAVDLCRRFVDAGARVAVVMTEDSKRFVGVTTFDALSTEGVHTSLWDDGSPIPHTRLGQWAEVIVVAPATARLLSAYVSGYSHDLLTTTLIATRAPVVVCPAMHTEMWEHPAVRANVAALSARGVTVVEPQEGRLAGGDVGAGRLADADTIERSVGKALEAGASSADDLRGVRVLVTAGGTREPIDAVRVIANRSSGKQGHAIADEAARRGADVTLVTTTDRPCAQGVRRVAVETAAQMFEAVREHFPRTDVVVMTAAVADFRPVAPVDGKIKKQAGVPEIRLEPTPDILAWMGQTKAHGQILVGFAAETEDLLENANRKLEGKNLDLLVANDVARPGAGFGHDTNEVVILERGGGRTAVGMAPKPLIARAVLDSVVELQIRQKEHR